MAGPGQNFQMDLRSKAHRRQRQSPREGTERTITQKKGKRARARSAEEQTRKRRKTNDLKKAFRIVEEKMHHKWEELGHRLDLQPADIEGMKLKDREDTRKCCRAMLEQWRSANGESASLDTLCNAIRACKRVDVAEQIEDADGDSSFACKPDAPEEVEVMETTESWIKIKWTPTATCEDGIMMGYTVEYSEVGSGAWAKAHEQYCLSTDTTEFEVGGLTKNKQYHFRVSSVNRGCVQSEPTYSAWGIAKPQGTPGKPRNLRVTDVNSVEGTVSLQWLKPEDNGGSPISSYIVEKLCDTQWEDCIQIKEQQCKVKQINPIEGQRFRVSAINTKGHRSDPTDMEDPELRIQVNVKNSEQNRAAQNALWKEAFDPQGLKGKTMEDGSIVYVYSCQNVAGLQELWSMYCRGKVRQYFQKLLVTRDVLRACGASNVELDVTIDPDDVRACCKHLLLTYPDTDGYRVLKTPTKDDYALMKKIDVKITDPPSGSVRRGRHMEKHPSDTTRPKKKKEDAMEVTKPLLHVELQGGPLKELTANLQPYKGLPTAQRFLKAYSCLEKAVVILNSASSSGHQEGEGVEHLLEGLMLMECVGPDAVNPVLYDQSWLHLDKTHLDNHVFAQLQANPNSTPCLLIQALQLPHGHTRIDAINHVIDIVLQRGETDPIYKHLTYMYCALGITTLAVTKQAGLALSAYASALMYKPDDMLTLQLTALCSVSVSVSQAIRQFRHFLATAPSCHEAVPWALYHLASLYSQQDTYVHRDTILQYYSMAQEADTNRLPAFKQVQSEHTEPASKGYKQVMVYVQTS